MYTYIYIYWVLVNFRTWIIWIWSTQLDIIIFDDFWYICEFDVFRNPELEWSLHNLQYSEPASKHSLTSGYLQYSAIFQWKIIHSYMTCIVSFHSDVKLQRMPNFPEDISMV